MTHQDKNLNVLALIPARGGSKGVPRKNVLDVAGKPLISWTIDAALGARCVTHTVVSTDNDEIMDVAKVAGARVPFQRPAALATDTATSIDVALHALDTLETSFDYVVLLQPTSPLRTSHQIDEMFAFMLARGGKSCVSICEVETPPYLMVEIVEDDRIKPVIPTQGRSLRRQDLPKSYELNGAIYMVTPKCLRATKAFVSPKTLGFVMDRAISVDIDTVEDVMRASRYLARDDSAAKAKAI